jgi:hypothetical protein
VGNPNGLSPLRYRLVELSAFSQATDEKDSRENHREIGASERTIRSIAGQSFDIPFGDLSRAWIVGKRMMDYCEAQVQVRFEPEVVQTSGHGQAALGAVERSAVLSRNEEVAACVGQDSREPDPIAKCRRQRLGGADVLNHSIVFTEYHVCIAKVAPHIDRLLDRVVALWEVLQGDECLIQVRHRLPIGARLMALAPAWRR